jgi:hypothetical protein
VFALRKHVQQYRAAVMVVVVFVVAILLRSAALIAVMLFVCRRSGALFSLSRAKENEEVR